MIANVPNIDLYSNSDPAAYMRGYIRRHFSDVLGDHVALLEQPGGLDALASLLRAGAIPARKKTTI